MVNLQLARNIKVLRENANLTQAHLAAHLNITRQAYSHYELGNHAPDLDTIIQISQFYNLSIDELVYGNFEETLEEASGPYGRGLRLKNHDTLYMTEQEIKLIMGHRQMSKLDRDVLEGFIESKTNKKTRSHL